MSIRVPHSFQQVYVTDDSAETDLDLDQSDLSALG